MKILIIAIIGFAFLFELFLNYLNQRSLKNINPRTYEIYNQTEYQKWLAYRHESLRFGLVTKIFNLVWIIGLLAFNIFAVYYNWLGSFGLSPMLTSILFIVGYFLAEVITSFGFNYYDTFKIEQKYGFNKKTPKLFIKDTIIQLIIVTVFLGGLMIGFNVLFDQTGPYFILYASVSILAILIVLPIVQPFFTKLFNKVTPLEEGTLKDKILTYIQSVNYAAEGIYTMDASKRSTRSNAYFSGYGKFKRIVLYDTLIEQLSEEEVVAVLAHEIGHAKHKDVVKLYLLNTLVFALLLALLYFMASYDAFSLAFGFTSIHFLFVSIIFFHSISVVLMFLQIPMMIVSRKAEYKADAFSASTYQKEPMIGALKTLVKENYANLNPHPFVVAIGHSHPTLFQRVDAIEKL